MEDLELAVFEVDDVRAALVDEGGVVANDDDRRLLLTLDELRDPRLVAARKPINK